MFDTSTEFILFFVPVSRVVLGPTQPPLQWVPAAVTADAQGSYRSVHLSRKSRQMALYLQYTLRHSWRGASLIKRTKLLL